VSPQHPAPPPPAPPPDPYANPLNLYPPTFPSNFAKMWGFENPGVRPLAYQLGRRQSRPVSLDLPGYLDPMTQQTLGPPGFLLPPPEPIGDGGEGDGEGDGGDGGASGHDDPTGGPEPSGSGDGPEGGQPSGPGSQFGGGAAGGDSFVDNPTGGMGTMGGDAGRDIAAAAAAAAAAAEAEAGMSGIGAIGTGEGEGGDTRAFSLMVSQLAGQPGALTYLPPPPSVKKKGAR
jgi:hypothetical protein